MFFQKKVVYMGDSLKEFNKIRVLLETRKIKFKYNIISHDNVMLSPGLGTGRSVSGINSSLSGNKIYEILVREQDYAMVQEYLKKFDE